MQACSSGRALGSVSRTIYAQRAGVGYEKMSRVCPQSGGVASQLKHTHDRWVQATLCVLCLTNAESARLDPQPSISKP